MSDTIPQGWQCPVCKKVHAPHIDGCNCHERKGYNMEELKKKFFPNMEEEPEPVTLPITTPAPKWDKIIVGDPPGWLTNPTITVTSANKVTIADSQTWRYRTYL